MEFRELEVMWNYYYGMSKVQMIWDKEMEQLKESNLIKRIFEVIDDDYNEVWYLIRDKKEKSYILKSKCRNEYAKDVMKKYKKNYKFYTVNSEIIKIFDKGIFPIIFKVSEKKFSNFYNEVSNINNCFLHNYYSKVGNQYKAVREYRNKVEYEVFNTEYDAIYWCSDYSITKDIILKNEIRPLNLLDMVCEYKI